MIGVGTIVPKELLIKAPYPPANCPPNVTYTDDEWPTDTRSGSRTKHKIFRLNFLAEDGVDAAENKPQIGHLIKYVKQHGGILTSIAKESITNILPSDLEPLVIKKFDYIAKAQKKAQRVAKKAAENEGEEEPAEVVQLQLSRARAVSAILIKEPALLELTV